MSANSYGIIVEGGYDSVAYEAMIRRLAAPGAHIRSFVCRGKPQLMAKFPGFLEALKYEIAGGPVDMAIVIVDADGHDPVKLEGKLQSRIKGRRYPFDLGVRFHAVRNALEAWLLADVNAINAAIQRRFGPPVTRSHDTPEDMPNPKVWLRKLLADHKIIYTPEVGREIAQDTNLEVLCEKCPRFRIFRELVDC